MVRALGLRGQQGAASFTDVARGDWHHDVIGTASAYGLIRGFEDGRFAADERITREQAMVIIAQAMALTGLQGTWPDPSENGLLQSFADAAQISGWAVRGVADSVQAGIVSGRDQGFLAPQDHLSRAEAAVLVYRLLVQSGLIDG